MGRPEPINFRGLSLNDVSHAYGTRAASNAGGHRVDWFERLTGFREGSYPDTQARLSMRDGRLISSCTDRTWAVGTLTMPSLAELRAAAVTVHHSSRLRLSIVEGDVRAMHYAPENRGALFQVASQFNMLEMVSSEVTPEEGITRYAFDRTQGPACAMAAGAALIYRNYLVPVAGRIGQIADHQLDGLADVGAALARSLGVPVDHLWTMRNGYVLAKAEGLAAINRFIQDGTADEVDELRSRLRVGLHQDVEATDVPPPGPLVSQVFCSALPVSYGRHPTDAWAPFAGLVLEAAYEATLLAGRINAARGVSNRVLLTRLGGGAFGNADEWIDAAMLRALRRVGDDALDVAIVSHGPPAKRLQEFVRGSGFVS